MKFLKNKTLQEAVLLLAIGCWLVWYSLDGYNAAFNKDWSQSPFLFPLVVAGILLVLAVLLLGQAVVSLRSNTEAGKKETASKQSLLRVVIVIGMCLVYYAALRFISLPYLACTLGGITLRLSTFELTTIVFLVVMMLYLGVRKKAVLICVPLGTTLFLSIMFRSLLHVILP